MSRKILDACCGSRMFWFDKENPDVLFMDNRKLDDVVLCDGRTINIDPDVVGDFRNMPFEDNTFDMVVFDPPHLLRAGDSSWLARKYGKLDKNTWRDDLAKGFLECFRVLKDGGFLIFKWSEIQIKVSEIVKLLPVPPLFGQRGGKTHWMVFVKKE
jgi:SAM-dependent methyltransferase